MNEYLSKEAVMQKFFERGSGYIDMLTMKTMVDEIPAADVQLVKHGRWIGIYEYCEKNGYVPSGMGIYYWCSECDKAEQKTSDFCPHCGARMDLEDGETE